VNKIKYQYFLVVTVLFIGALYFTHSEDTSVVDDKEPQKIPQNYLRAKRTVAQSLEPNKVKTVSLKKIQRKKIARPLMVPSERSISSSNHRKYKRVVLGDYNFVKNLRAIKNTKDNRDLYPNAQAKLGHLFVEGDSFDSQSLSIVVNPQDGVLGIFTKQIKLKLNRDSIGAVESDLAGFNYNIETSYPHLSIYHLKFDTDQEVLEAYDLIKSRPYIKRSSIEVIYYERGAR
jgi:hypothetical protein